MISGNDRNAHRSCNRENRRGYNNFDKSKALFSLFIAGHNIVMRNLDLVLLCVALIRLMPLVLQNCELLLTGTDHVVPIMFTFG